MKMARGTLFVALALALLALLGARPAGALAADDALSKEVRLQLAERGRASVLVHFAERPQPKVARKLGRIRRIARAVDHLTDAADSTQQDARSLLRSAGVPFRELWITNTIAVRKANAELLHRLARLPDVERITLNETVKLADRGKQAGDPATATPLPSELEQLTATGADQAWSSYGARGQGIVIGVLDTGVNWEHEALRDRYRGWDGQQVDHTGNWHDATHPHPNHSPDEPIDTDGHGTHVTGIAVGSASGAPIGVAPQAKFISCRSFSGEEAEIDEILGCMQWLLAPTDESDEPQPRLAPHIVNHSWGIFEDNAAVREAVDRLTDAGILQVFAAGNFGPFCSSITFPAYMESVLSVGAMAHDSADIISFFSGRGPAPGGGIAPDVVAPGEFIWSASNEGDGYIQMIGTSQATPIAAGTVALAWSAYPGLIGDIARTQSLIRDTAIAVPSPDKECDSQQEHPNNVFGWGRVDSLAAVKKALELKPPTPSPVPPTPPPVRSQADAQIAGKPGGPYVGAGVYSTTGADQLMRARVAPRKAKTFFIRVRNDGNQTATFQVVGCVERRRFAITYLTGGRGNEDVTDAVAAGAYELADVAPGRGRILRLRIRARARAAGKSTQCRVQVRPTTGGGVDAVRAKIKARRR